MGRLQGCSGEAKRVQEGGHGVQWGGHTGVVGRSHRCRGQVMGVQWEVTGCSGEVTGVQSAVTQMQWGGHVGTVGRS